MKIPVKIRDTEYNLQMRYISFISLLFFNGLDRILVILCIVSFMGSLAYSRNVQKLPFSYTEEQISRGNICVYCFVDFLSIPRYSYASNVEAVSYNSLLTQNASPPLEENQGELPENREELPEEEILEEEEVNEFDEPLEELEEAREELPEEEILEEEGVNEFDEPLEELEEAREAGESGELGENTTSGSGRIEPGNPPETADSVDENTEFQSLDINPVQDTPLGRYYSKTGENIYWRTEAIFFISIPFAYLWSSILKLVTRYFSVMGAFFEGARSPELDALNFSYSHGSYPTEGGDPFYIFTWVNTVVWPLVVALNDVIERTSSPEKWERVKTKMRQDRFYDDVIFNTY